MHQLHSEEHKLIEINEKIKKLQEKIDELNQQQQTTANQSVHGDPSLFKRDKRAYKRELQILLKEKDEHLKHMESNKENYRTYEAPNN